MSAKAKLAREIRERMVDAFEDKIFRKLVERYPSLALDVETQGKITLSFCLRRHASDYLRLAKQLEKEAIETLISRGMLPEKS